MLPDPVSILVFMGKIKAFLKILLNVDILIILKEQSL